MQKKNLFLACFFIYTDCIAQQYPFVHYTPKDGLVNSRVRKAYQDSKGKMYFITFGGLSVYDGARFKNYTTQNGLAADLVNDVLEVGEDSLLIAVNTSELNVLVKGRMKKAVTSGNCPVVNQFLKSNDGIIYASTDQGLYRFHANRFEKLSAFSPPQKIPIEYLGVIAEYKDHIIFTTNDLKNNIGLFLYDKTKDKITDALLQLSVLDMLSDHNGNVWVSTISGMKNLDTIALAAGKLELRKSYDTSMSRENFIGNIHFNQENELFVATGNKGIVHYTKEGGVVPITSPELFTTSVQNFFIDRENVLWICNDGNGLYKLSSTKLQSTDIFPTDNKSGIKALAIFSPDSVWVLMNNRQWILHTFLEDKTFTTIPAVQLFPLQCNNTQIYATDLHSLYIASFPANSQIIRFTKILTLPDTAKFGGRAIFDPAGNVIMFENRNICVVQNGKLIAAYPFSELDLVEGMHIDKMGQLWMINRGGFMVFSLHPGDPLHYLQKEFQTVHEFETASPRCMAIDRNEVMWLGTRYHGLMAFEYKNKRLKKLHHFQTQNGLTDNFVTALTCDRDDNIIIGTQTGLDRLVKTRDNGYQLENITKSNNIFAFISYVWNNSRNETFALTNTRTVFQVEPVVAPTIIAAPQLLIEEMKVNGKPFLLNSSPPQLEYYQRNISFSIAAPTFIDERQVKYSYRLSGGGNNEWSDTSSIADINLLNLSPGHYTLKVKSFFPSTSYSPKEIEFPFQILPPWWQTVLFRLIAASSVMLLLILGFRLYYSNKLRRQKAVLERKQAIEKERTRIATDMHDDLGAGLSRIKFLSETIGIKRLKEQPIEEDIISIRYYSHEMIDKMGEIVWALNEKNDSLSDLLAYTRAYAVEYLSQNGIRCVVEAPEDFPSSFVSGEFRRNIYLTVKEALHNIVKHSRTNTVSIRFNIQRGLTITIQDDGIGFDSSKIKPYSNGLVNMQKRMKDLNGSFEIESNGGTTIRLSVSLPS